LVHGKFRTYENNLSANVRVISSQNLDVVLAFSDVENDLMVETRMYPFLVKRYSIEFGSWLDVDQIQFNRISRRCCVLSISNCKVEVQACFPDIFIVFYMYNVCHNNYSFKLYLINI
jgi:hypothetical protein